MSYAHSENNRHVAPQPVHRPPCGSRFALIALLVALLGFFALSNMASIRESAVQVESGLVPKMRLVSDIREIMLRIRTISLRMALDPNPASLSQYRSQMDTP